MLDGGGDEAGTGLDHPKGAAAAADGRVHGHVVGGEEIVTKVTTLK